MSQKWEGGGNPNWDIVPNFLAFLFWRLPLDTIFCFEPLLFIAFFNVEWDQIFSVKKYFCSFNNIGAHKFYLARST